MEKTILLVDDDTLLLNLLTRILESNGYQVVNAPDAEAGLEILESTKPDLVICDYKLPISDGLEFALQLRQKQETKTTPFVLLTGMEFTQISNLEIVGHRIEIMMKPFTVEDLLSRVESYLKRM